ncbi:MAG: LptF/LptG family permease [Pseudomonadota bacterium]
MTQIHRADRYLLGQMMPRMLAALAVTLVALLIERLLRLLDFVTGHGADLGPVLGLALNLLPHYMGLALPAAFCVAILSTMSALSKNNEIDALEAAGWSLRRIGAPFIVCAVLLSLLSSLLFGVIQPYSRYAFSEIRHSIANSGWNGRIEQGVFLDLGDEMTLSATEIDATGRVLRGVFVLRNDDLGETAITADQGIVVPTPDGKSVYLVLRDGRALTEDGGRLDFDDLRLSREFSMAQNPFRPRGGSERELTYAELWREMHPSLGVEVEPRFQVEFHGRLIRAISLIGIALISVPLAVSRKRAPGWQRIAIAIIILAVYDNLIKFVSGMGKLGQIDPALGLWGLCALFMGISAWLFATTPGQGARSPFRALFRAIAEMRSPVRARVEPGE